MADPPRLRAPRPATVRTARVSARQENRALFIEAMADPLRRGIAFDVVERNCRERFAEGEDGIKLYRELLGLVRLGNVSEAVAFRNLSIGSSRCCVLRAVAPCAPKRRAGAI